MSPVGPGGSRETFLSQKGVTEKCLPWVRRISGDIFEPKFGMPEVRESWHLKIKKVHKLVQQILRISKIKKCLVRI